MNKITLDGVKKVSKQLGKLISIISIVFIMYAVYKLGFNFDSVTNWPVFLLLSFFCVILKCITVFIMGTAWADWLELFAEHTINKKAALIAYIKANIGKYLPGNMMHYVERNIFAANLGVSQKKLAIGSVIEVFGLVGIAILLTMVISFQYLELAFLQIFNTDSKKILVVLILCLITMGGLICTFKLRIKKFIMDCGVREFFKTLFVSMLKYSIVLSVLGLIMVILYMYMGGEINWKNSTLIVSGYIIAWVFGFIIPGASGGIGVRELITTALLGPVVGIELILTLSVIHRLITIVGDFFSYLLVIIQRKDER